jgi:hypothetical protein
MSHRRAGVPAAGQHAHRPPFGQSDQGFFRGK